jgi:hypothetical protein
MSILERICEQDGCLQCWADAVISADDKAIEAAIAKGVQANPMVRMVGPPTIEEMISLKRSGRRETKLIARLVLLEPHECGKVPPGNDANDFEDRVAAVVVRGAMQGRWRIEP